MLRKVRNEELPLSHMDTKEHKVFIVNDIIFVSR